MAHSNSNFVSLVDNDGFDDKDLEMAIVQSLEKAYFQPGTVVQKASLYEDDDLERALAESMRTYAEEQGTVPNLSGHKRSSSPDPTIHSQQQHHADLTAQHHQQQWQQDCLLKSDRRLQRPSGQITGDRPLSSCKRPRSSSSSALQNAAEDPAEASNISCIPPHATNEHGQQSRNVMAAPSGCHPQQQAARQVMCEVQRSSSLTKAAAGLLTWPTRGILQPVPLQVDSTSPQDLHTSQQHGQDNAHGHNSHLPIGSRHASLAARLGSSSQQDFAVADGFDFGDEDLDTDLISRHSDSSMSSIAHETGLPHTTARSGAALLQIAAVQQPVRHVGPGPLPGDPTDWCIFSRQFYPGQHIYWQQCKDSLSYSGRVLSLDVGSSPTDPVTYTVEVFNHTPAYVEASAEQLHPQLLRGDRVWCKPAASKPSQWSHKGQLFQEVHVHGGHMSRQNAYEWSPWVLGQVMDSYAYNHRNPVADVRIVSSPDDGCWFKHCQLELVVEVGESSTAADARAVPTRAPDAHTAATAAAAAAAGVLHEGCDVEEVQSQKQQQQQAGEAVDTHEQHTQQVVQHRQPVPNHETKLLQQHQLQDTQSAPAQTQQAGVQLQQQQQEATCVPCTATELATPCAGDAQCAVAAGLQSSSDHATAAAHVVHADAAAFSTDLAAAEGSPHDTGAAAPSSLLSGLGAAATAQSGLDAENLPAEHQDDGHGLVQPPAALQPVLSPQQVCLTGQPLAMVTKAAVLAGTATEAPCLVVEGTGESAEGLFIEAVVGDSCAAAGCEGGPEVAGAVGCAPSPRPVSHEQSHVGDSYSTRLPPEGFGET